MNTKTVQIQTKILNFSVRSVEKHFNIYMILKHEIQGIPWI